MITEKRTCPSREKNGISRWAKLFASCPGHARCGYRNSKRKIKFSLSLMFAQLIADIFLLAPVNVAGGYYSISTIFIFFGLVIFLVLPYFGRLQSIGPQK